MLKRIIKIVDGDKTKIVCMQFENKFGKVTLGGDKKLLELIYDIYMYCFDECDGDPQFYEVTRGCERIKFNCNMKNYNSALDKMAGEGYIVEEVESFGRMM